MGTRLYVGNLPYEASEADIQAFFERTGGRKVTQVKIVTDRETGRPRGFAFVELTEPHMVQTAIAEFHGADFGGRTIVVNEAREPQRKSYPPAVSAGRQPAQRRGGGYG
jgi:RNA recognition motif-containing protein